MEAVLEYSYHQEWFLIQALEGYGVDPVLVVPLNSSIEVYEIVVQQQMINSHVDVKSGIWRTCSATT